MRRFGSSLYVALTAANLVEFGWNGQIVEVGKPEVVTNERRQRAEGAMDVLRGQMEQEMRALGTPDPSEDYLLE
ncbi:hypothetical protein IRY61_05710 [Candidatus Saccharibacteria bacterium]|nr:hypothetical protein [Candidatus Saccharibacteria bacterium]